MQAVRMHYQGMSASEIAKIFDVSP
ncbi:MAG TPA: hypothetical protein DCY64_23515 [Hydrogenophaga sp.]|nr:hypothetical protein [Hydrogenophaga sp.]HBU17588.1 hypothetical protein [Hydrogenophaga sp.]